MGRDVAIDRLRGLAIGLMIADHVLAMSGLLMPLRLTVTRASLPLFMLVSGWLLRSREISSRRLVELSMAAVGSTVIVAALPFMPKFDVLVVLLAALLFWPLARRYPVEALVICVVGMATFPVVWDGYHPLELLALLIVGRWSLGSWSPLRCVGESLPSWCELMGRWPLVWYVGHLACLVVVWQLVEG